MCSFLQKSNKLDFQFWDSEGNFFPIPRGCGKVVWGIEIWIAFAAHSWTQPADAKKWTIGHPTAKKNETQITKSCLQSSPAGKKKSSHRNGCYGMVLRACLNIQFKASPALLDLQSLCHRLCPMLHSSESWFLALWKAQGDLCSSIIPVPWETLSSSVLVRHLNEFVLHERQWLFFLLTYEFYYFSHLQCLESQFRPICTVICIL